jgi:hypothetical protein
MPLRLRGSNGGQMFYFFIDFLTLNNMSYLINQLEKKIETKIAHVFKKVRVNSKSINLCVYK